MAIVKRLDKGSALTYAELDGNFDHLTAEDTAVRAEFAAADVVLSGTLTTAYQAADDVAQAAAEATAQAALDAHTGDTSGAHAASAISYTPTGTVAAVTVQAAIDEVVSDLAASSGSSLVGFMQSGTGANATTVQTKLRESVSVKDFGAVGDGVADDTAAFVAAQAAHKHIFIPAGTYLIDNLRIQDQVNLIGAGYENTILKQKETDNYAINCLSDASVGQLLGVSLRNFQVSGATGATVAAVNIEANGIYAITHSEFDFYATNTYSPLRINCPDAGAVYNCKVKVTSNTSAIGIESMGVYNEYDFFITTVTTSPYVYDLSSNCVFNKVVTEGQAHFSGQANVVRMFECENFYGTADGDLGGVLTIDGNRQTFESVTIVNVPNAKCEVGVDIFAQNTTIGMLSIIGTTTTGTPNYPISLASTSSGVLNNVLSDCLYKADQYVNGAYLRQWTFGGYMDELLLSNPMQGSLVTNINTTAANGDTVEFGTTATLTDWFDVFLLNISGTISTLTINLPPAPKHQQVAKIASAQGTVTALTLTPGATHSVVGEPANLVAETSFTLVFDTPTLTWYRID